MNNLEKWIISEIRKQYNLHRNHRVILDHSTCHFKMNIGECISSNIPYPKNVMREIKLEMLGV